jgi:hypothetical protein
MTFAIGAGPLSFLAAWTIFSVLTALVVGPLLHVGNEATRSTRRVERV